MLLAFGKVSLPNKDEQLISDSGMVCPSCHSWSRKRYHRPVLCLYGSRFVYTWHGKKREHQVQEPRCDCFVFCKKCCPWSMDPFGSGPSWVEGDGKDDVSLLSGFCLCLDTTCKDMLCLKLFETDKRWIKVVLLNQMEVWSSLFRHCVWIYHLYIQGLFVCLHSLEKISAVFDYMGLEWFGHEMFWPPINTVQTPAMTTVCSNNIILATSRDPRYLNSLVCHLVWCPSFHHESPRVQLYLLFWCVGPPQNNPSLHCTPFIWSCFTELPQGSREVYQVDS